MRFRKNLIVKTCFLTLILLSTLALVANHQLYATTLGVSEPQGVKLEVDSNKGRIFVTLSLHPDDKELAFTECYDKQEGDKECQVLLYNFTSQLLRYYDLPKGYFYTDASISPGGNYILMRRFPKDKQEEQKLGKNLPNLRRMAESEIAMMKFDGSDFRVLKLENGLKFDPIMSCDETKIAYYRGKPRPLGSKTPAAGFDIWEINLETKKEKLFAGPYKFFEVGQMQYLPGDEEILLHAWGGHIAFSIWDYDRKFKNSSIYTLKAGERGLPDPLVIEGIQNMANPAVDKEGNLYFSGEENGIRFFRKSPNRNLERWDWSVLSQGIEFLTPDASGSYVFFIYVINGYTKSGHVNLVRRSIAFLNTKTSEWKKLDIPPIDTATPIPVTTTEDIEIKSPGTFNSKLFQKLIIKSSTKY